MSKLRPRLMIAAALLVGVWLAAMAMALGIRITRLLIRARDVLLSFRAAGFITIHTDTSDILTINGFRVQVEPAIL